MANAPRQPGGIVHTYQRYDPQRFPPPSGPAGPDLAGAAMDHMMAFGDRRKLTEEDLANAVKIDPSQIAGLGPSLDALIRLLEEPPPQNPRDLRDRHRPGRCRAAVPRHRG